MVKFVLPGDDKTEYRICGHGYRGGTVYDNEFHRLPEKEIAKFIIPEKRMVAEPVKSVEKPNLELKETESEKQISLNNLKAYIKSTQTVKELKEEAKKMGLKYNGLNEDALVDLLVSKGFKG